MNYLSIEFAIFTTFLWALYLGLPVRFRPWLLLCGSLAFYVTFDWVGLLILLIVAVSTFVVARYYSGGGRQKIRLFLCIGINASLWLMIKVLPWIVTMSNRAIAHIGFDVHIPEPSLFSVVGISYYMLIAFGYLIDVYRGKIVAERNFLYYLLFVSYFPAIVQGPISRYDQLMPQLRKPKSYTMVQAREHFLLILFGLVKKMVIADRLGLFVNTCFDNYQDYSGIILYVGVVAYALQLYLDFSGCVDLCRGVSGLFGVELIQNFNRPYKTTSIRAFWQCWHISLSQWLRDYVYIPLGGNRKGRVRKYANLLITFLVSGLWHGAGFSFFLWGLLHGVYQIVGEITLPLRSWVKKRIGIVNGSFSERLLQTLITFHLVSFAWIFFRADSLTDGVEYVRCMFASLDLWRLLDGSIYAMGVDRNAFLVILLHVAFLLWAENSRWDQRGLVRGISRQPIIVRWPVFYMLILDIVLFGVYGSGYDLSGFMYGGF